jgi:hypothetical protein
MFDPEYELMVVQPLPRVNGVLSDVVLPVSKSSSKRVWACVDVSDINRKDSKMLLFFMNFWLSMIC